jgi:hypothetical protein
MTVPLSSPSSPVPVRFVVDGLLATVDSFVSGGLPVPRLARELDARIDALAQLCSPSPALTRLLWLGREVARLDRALREAGRTGLDPAERSRLEATLQTFRDVLVALPDPAGADRPAARPTGPRAIPAVAAARVVPAADRVVAAAPLVGVCSAGA